VEFNDAIRAQLRSEQIRFSRLVELRYKSGTQRYWQGHTPFEDLAGTTWYPTWGIGEIEGLAQSTNGTAPEIRFTLSGIDPQLKKLAIRNTSEYFGRLVLIYWQFFAADWSPISTPRAITWGLMRSITSRRERVDEGTLSTLVLSAETPFDGRIRSRNGYLTDRDQKTRHPGDRMLEQVAGISAREVKFPDY
jgi:hypothetical protein